MLASLDLQWWQHMVVRGLHENRITADVIDPTKTILIPRIQLRTSDRTISFKISRRRFPTKISFAMPVMKARGQTLKSVRINPASPGISMARYALNLPEFFT
jgi:hypothetical protein